MIKDLLSHIIPFIWMIKLGCAALLGWYFGARIESTGAARKAGTPVGVKEAACNYLLLLLSGVYVGLVGLLDLAAYAGGVLLMWFLHRGYRKARNGMIKKMEAAATQADQTSR